MAETESLDGLEARAAASPASAEKPTRKKGCKKGVTISQGLKLLIISFILWVFFHSNLFLDSVPGLWSGASDANGLTNRGIYITALLNVLALGMMYFLVTHDLL